MKGMVCKKKKKRNAIKHTLTLSGGDYCTYLHVMALSTKPPPPRFLTSKKKKSTLKHSKRTCQHRYSKLGSLLVKAP